MPTEYEDKKLELIELCIAANSARNLSGINELAMEGYAASIAEYDVFSNRAIRSMTGVTMRRLSMIARSGWTPRGGAFNPATLKDIRKMRKLVAAGSEKKEYATLAGRIVCSGTSALTLERLTGVSRKFSMAQAAKRRAQDGIAQ